MSARRRLLGGILAMTVALLAAPSASAITVDPGFSVLYVKGDAGDDQIVVECARGVVAVNGTPAVESHVPCQDISRLSVTGFGGNDVIRLGGFGTLAAGSDLLFGAPGGLFEISGGDGDDTLISDADEGLMIGGAGDDRLRAENAVGPTLIGGPGDDRLVPGLFLSTLLAGSGDDVMHGAPGLTFVYAGPGSDTLTGHGGTELAIGGRGPDRLVGGGDRDGILGSSGADRIFGGQGPDLIAGGPGRDGIHGGPGRDEQFQGAAPKRALGRFVERILEQVLGPSLGFAARRFLSRIR